MLHQDERIEHLISRRLDGELTDDERLELDRALIRSPEHRRMLEESERIDALCAELIPSRVAKGSAAVADQPAAPVGATPDRRGSRRAWWLLPGAVAACFGWVVLSRSMDAPGVGFDPGRAIDARRAIPVRRADASTGLGPNNVRRIGTRTGVTDGRRDTGLYRVIGDDGRLYLIELDRLRTWRRSAARGARNEL